jgi:hypothetical protein
MATTAADMGPDTTKDTADVIKDTADTTRDMETTVNIKILIICRLCFTDWEIGEF